MGTLRVTVHEAATVVGPEGAQTRVEAELDPPIRGTDSIWWSVDATPRLAAGPAADAALLAVVGPATVAALDVQIAGGAVTPGLLAGVDEAQRAWSQWDGRPVIEVRAEESTAAPRPREAAAVLAYSGGVDSAYTAWRHITGAAGHQTMPLAAAVFVEGFDIPLADPNLDRAQARIAPPIEDRGVPVVRAATNIRALHDDWEAYHGFALASLLTFVGGGQRAALVAASDTYERPVLGWGSNPLTDHHLGSDELAIRHDGSVDRVSKLRSLGEWPDLVQRLRFCWAGTDHATNCGSCLKCVTTAMALQVLDLPLTCFAHPPSDETIRDVLAASRPHGFTRTYNQPILDEAIRRGLDAAWVPALRTRLRRARYGPAIDTLMAPARRRLPDGLGRHLGRR